MNIYKRFFVAKQLSFHTDFSELLFHFIYKQEMKSPRLSVDCIKKKD